MRGQISRPSHGWRLASCGASIDCSSCHKIRTPSIPSSIVRPVPEDNFGSRSPRAKNRMPPLTAREPAMPLTLQREIEIEAELARIEREIDREIEHHRRKSLKWRVVSKPPPPPL